MMLKINNSKMFTRVRPFRNPYKKEHEPENGVASCMRQKNNTSCFDLRNKKSKIHRHFILINDDAPQEYFYVNPFNCNYINFSKYFLSNPLIPKY